MSLRPDQIDDLVTSTLRELGRGRWTDISYDLQEYIAMSRLLKRNKVGFRGGEQVQWQVQVATSGAARTTALYDTLNPVVSNVLKKANIPWTFVDTHFNYDDREDEFNRGPQEIVRLLKVRKHDAMVDLAKLLEVLFWSLPDTGADNKKPYGLPYWCVSSTTQGFNGGNPSGFSSGAGNLDSTTYTQWANYTDGYTVVSDDDFVSKLRRAATFTHFMSPHAHPSYNKGDRFAYYTNYDVLGTLERLLKASNDNLGNDFGKYDGAVRFRGSPVIWAPYLENDSSDPFYGVNWGVFRPIFKTGEYMKTHPPVRDRAQIRVATVLTDCCIQYECRDRRRLFVLSK